MIVLDTNVLSEVLKPTPSSEVIAWMRQQPSSQLFTTTVTQAEILYGVELLPNGKRKTKLQAMVAAVFEGDFDVRILPFDSEAAQAFPKVASLSRAAGHPMAGFDAQIAAITYSRRAILATRNTADFEHCGVPLFNPWIDF